MAQAPYFVHFGVYLLYRLRFLKPYLSTLGPSFFGGCYFSTRFNAAKELKPYALTLR